MTAATELWLALGYCAFMLLLALLFRWKLPKKINYLYGYRTQRSMLNDTIWKATNLYAANFMLRICLLSFIIPPVLYFVFPNYNLLITIIIHTILITSIIFYTEKYITKNFDGDGNPV